MKCGYFDDLNREYVITTPKLPVRWINYLGTLDFGGFVDHTGGGVLCGKDPALNRITKYIPQLPPSDMNGQTAYIRVTRGNDDRKIFSPFFTPVLEPLDRYECRIGLSYSTFIVESSGLRVTVTVFIPRNGNREIRRYSIENISSESLTVDCVPVVEYTHFDALKQFTNADWVPQTMQSRLERSDSGIRILTQFAYMKKDLQRNYFTSSMDFSSFETDRQLFLGDFGYRGWRTPAAMEQDELSDTQVHRGDNIAAMMHHLGILESGEKREFVTQLGQWNNWCETFTSGDAPEWDKIELYNSFRNVDAALADWKDFWDDYLSVYQVRTPDEGMNSMINIHNPRQCYTTKNWSRYLSSYQLGLGARGIGFRDSSQDVMGVLSSVPDEGCELLEKLLSVQCRDGHAMHQFFPLTMEANNGDAREMEDRPDYYGDDHLWSVLAVTAYLKETGDMNFLKKELPFFEKTGGKEFREEVPLEKGTVFEHLKRALRFTHDHLGTHGIPLLGFADWNDTVNLRTGAESVFNANLFGAGLKEMIELCEFLGEDELASRYSLWYQEMKSRFNEAVWDGEWYIRYFDSDGSPIGSSSNEYGKIFTNAQSWSIISGYADGDRAERALQSVYDQLNTSRGIKLSTPGYNRFDPNIGGVSTYPPGAKENGGIFLHSNPWVMIAETILGNGDRAFRYYSQINPAIRNDSIEEYELEPYCYAQNFLGDEHPQFGLARNSWLSGTSSWTYQAATKYILGIRPGYDGLIIDPCIPSEWSDYQITRKCRGTWYSISVKNPDGVSKGVSRITVDGEIVSGQCISYSAGSKPGTVAEQHGKDNPVIVEVVLG